MRKSWFWSQGLLNILSDKYPSALRKFDRARYSLTGEVRRYDGPGACRKYFRRGVNSFLGNDGAKRRIKPERCQVLPSSCPFETMPLTIISRNKAHCGKSGSLFWPNRGRQANHQSPKRGRRTPKWKYLRVLLCGERCTPCPSLPPLVLQTSLSQSPIGSRQ
jgi:hypothetical protein